MNQRFSSGRPVRGVQNQPTEEKLDHHSLQVSELDTLSKSSRMFDKVESSRKRPDAGSKGHCIDMRIVHVNNDESSDTSWTRLQ